MNQIVGTTLGGRKYLALVLEPGNMQAMRQGKRIHLRVEDMFPDGIPPRLELAIFYSDTPVADARALASEAEVGLDERTAREKTTLPHCPECRSTIEQLGVQNKTGAPVEIIFCPMCGCVLALVAAGGFKWPI